MWQEWGQSEALLWGIYRGSATYQVQVDLEQPGYRCSCPSRKFPCKHVQSLIQQPSSQQQTSLFEPPPTPAWASQWIAARRAKAANASNVDPNPSDDNQTLEKKPAKAAAKKRKDERHQRVLAGMERLENWLVDTIRHGLVHFEPQAISQCEAEAKRLIDAQAPGLASRVRRVADTVRSGPEWHERTLAAMGRLLMICRAYRNIETSGAAWGEDLKQFIGWNVRTDDWKDTNVVHDVWSVLGQRIEIEDRLRMERSWLAGRMTGRVVLHLQFAFGGQPFPLTIHPGTEWDAKMQIYPGALQQRVRAHEHEGAMGPISARPFAYPNWEAFLHQSATDLGRYPWLDVTAGMIQCVSISPHLQEPWQLVDNQGLALPMFGAAPWDWLAQSGGTPVDIAIEWDGERVRPLGMWDGNQYLVVS